MFAASIFLLLDVKSHSYASAGSVFPKPLHFVSGGEESSPNVAN